MLIGEYTHSFDEKNRISLPAKFRTEVGKKIVITRGLDACLFLYSGKAFEKFSEKLEDLSMGSVESRGFSRFLFGGAADVEVDSAGRILIPDFLRTFAKIEKSAIFVGVRERVEIWNEEMWATYRAKIEQQGDSLAEKLGDIGFI